MSTRAPDEPEAAWEAYRAYRALLPSVRSLDRLIAPGRSRMTLRRWSGRFGWQARIREDEAATPVNVPPPAPQPPLARVIPLPGCVPAEPAVLTIGSANDERGDAPAERADVCTETGDLLEHVERVLRQELAKTTQYTAAELQKIAAVAKDIASQRRAREIEAAHVEYDLSLLTDDEAAQLRGLCEKAQIAKPRVA